MVAATPLGYSLDIVDQDPVPIRMTKPKESRLIQYAKHLCKDSLALPQAIIENLVKDDYYRSSSLPHDFSMLFREANIASILIENFIQAQLSVSGLSPSTQPIQLVTKEDREGLDKFLDSYPHSPQTLADFLAQHYLRGKNYDIGQMQKLLNEEFASKLQLRLETYAQEYAKQHFKNLYKAAQEKSQRRGQPQEDPEILEKFIADRLLSKVVHLDDQGRPVVNREKLAFAIQFLFDQQFSLDENFFLVVCKFLNKQRKQSSVLAVREVTRDEIEEQAPGTQNNSASLTDPHFDYVKFFEQHIAPTIRHVKEKALNGTADQLHPHVKINFAGLQETEVTMPEAVLVLLKKVLDASANCQERDKNDLFNILPAEASKEVLAAQLNMAKEQIEWFFREYLSSADRESCKKTHHFIPEILACDDVLKLVRWIVYPGTFMKDLGETRRERQRELLATSKGGRILRIIRHESMQMLRILFALRKCLFYPEVRDRKIHMVMTKDYFVQALNIKEIGRYVHEFRMVEYLNEQQKSFYPPRYQHIMRGEEGFDAADGKIVYDDRIIYPVERKNFIEAEATIPILGQEEPKTIRFYYYAGEEWKTWHNKNDWSIGDNFLREKSSQPNFTDLSRSTIIPTNPEDYEILAEFFLRNAGSDGKKLKIRRKDENIQESSFDNHDGCVLSGYIERPIHDPELRDAYDNLCDMEALLEEIPDGNEDLKKKFAAGIQRIKEFLWSRIDARDPIRINFEQQIVRRLDEFLMYFGSDHTATSHSRYRAGRVTENVETILHPQLVYNDNPKFLRNLCFKEAA